MPAGQPFTALCQALARGPAAGRADLHLHSTASDGSYTPAQVVDLARRCGLAAIALTDHDTLHGYFEAMRCARPPLEVIPGVEITTRYQGRELHLLAYFVDPHDTALDEALEEVRRGRRERFAEMVRRLRGLGVSIEEEGPVPPSLGRRYLAELLVKQGFAGSVREAFSRWLGEGGRAFVPREGIPVDAAVALVRGGGGVASWAHPPYDEGMSATLAELAAMGLRAVEAAYPGMRPAQSRALREQAGRLGLAVTGGSDCHGPGPRGVGSVTISDEELSLLRGLAGGR
jgi:predicted metal-dependent phosphoesterase TrpH